MSGQSKRKPSEEPFTYSWYLPVPGGEGPGSAPPTQAQDAPPEEQQAEVSPPHQPDGINHRPKVSLGSIMNVSPSTLKIAGLAGWSIIAGGGMIALLATKSPPPMGNVLALVGVWAALSALIWFVPGKLIK